MSSNSRFIVVRSGLERNPVTLNDMDFPFDLTALTTDALRGKFAAA